MIKQGQKMQEKLRHIPSVSAVLSDTRISELMTEYSTAAITDLVREKLSQVRSTIDDESEVPTISQISDHVSAHIEQNWANWPTNVINATGVVIHTNLGRAPLSTESIQATIDSSKTYSDLELELDSGNLSANNRIAGISDGSTHACNKLLTPAFRQRSATSSKSSSKLRKTI